MGRGRRWRPVLGGFLAAGIVVYLGAIHAPPGPRSLRAFDPDRMADLEVRMWKAYYAKEKLCVAGTAHKRAEAAALRDRGGPHADWDTVSRLLQDSYRRLRSAVGGHSSGG